MTKKNILIFLSVILCIAKLSAQTTDTFNSSGSFVVPAGAAVIKVEAWGGGGGGANRTSNGVGAGGGGGAYSTSNLTVTSGQSYTYTVGGAGSGGGTNKNGGDSWFSLTGSTPISNATGILARGGTGATANSNTRGAGGTTSGYGTTKYSGGTGAAGPDTNPNRGGGGGSSGGTGANGNYTNNTTTSSTGGTIAGGGSGGAGRNINSQGAGDAGSSPGGGGGGSYRTGSNQNGGNGASGQVRVTYLPPITGNTSIASAGGTTTLSNAVSGGTWASLNAGVATVNPSTGVVTAVATGTAVITYTTADGLQNSVTIIVGNTSIVQTYSSSGNFTPPTGVNSIRVEAWGGGGGGANRTSNGVGAGGGGGAYSTSNLTVTSGQSYTYTVGGAGSGGGTNKNGGDSWFSLTGSTPISNATGILARGGTGATANSNTRGAGGTTSGYGTTKYSGGTGAAGPDTNPNRGGGGGSSGGTGANGNYTNNTTTSSTGGTIAGGGSGGAGRNINSQGAGNAGSSPGGGGGGSYRTGSNQNGGNGASGQVRITYLPPINVIVGSVNMIIGETTTLADVVSGGTWSSSSSGIASVNSSTGVVTANSIGTAIITYTVSGLTQTIEITVDNVCTAGIQVPLTSHSISNNTSPVSDQLFFDDFGTSNVSNGDMGRTTTPYMPATSYQFGSSYLTNGTSTGPDCDGADLAHNRARINDGYYAVVSPNYINQGWYPDDCWAPSWWVTINDYSGTATGAVLAINAGTLLRPFYERAATLTVGAKYKASFQMYLILDPARVAIDIKDAVTGNIIPGATFTSAVYGDADEGKWTEVSIEFTMPGSIEENAVCTTRDVIISFRNDYSQEDGNDWYVDNIGVEKIQESPACTPTGGCVSNGATSVNLNSLLIGTVPSGTTLVWFDNPNHTGLSVADPTSVSVPGTYYAFFYDSTNSCYNTDNSTVSTEVFLYPPCNTGLDCGEPVDGNAFNWTYNATGFPDATEGSIVTNTITQPASTAGFVFDIYVLDNSFNMTINGIQMATMELQFQGGNVTVPRSIRFKSDGAVWGSGGTPNIWTLNGTVANPILRVKISKFGNVTIYGSRTSGGLLEELELDNGNSFNTIYWNPYSSNNIVVTQYVIGQTIMDGYGYGLNAVLCHCTKPGTAGTPDGYTKVGISTLASRSDNWPEGTSIANGGVPNGFIALESHNKGFVITRVASSASITEPKKGMLIYDIAAACVKLYNGATWKCLERDCNDPRVLLDD